MTNALKATSHRPWPLPDRPWFMTQTWRDLLFAHWPLSAELLRSYIPEPFEIDTFDDEAWIGVVPFYMTDITVRDLIPIPFMSEFTELNVRTYVVYEDKPGVFFFSLDASSRLAVWGARTFYHLPYFNAEMTVYQDGEALVYGSRRTHRGVPSATFRGTYAPASDVYRAKAGTLEHWLTERYCLYTTDDDGRVLRGEIHHEQWPLQQATAKILDNRLMPADIELPDTEPLLHFSRELKVYIWPMDQRP